MERRSLVFTGPREIALRGERVTPATDEVVVSTSLSAINAGTELLVYRGEAPSGLPADETLDALDGDLSFPLRYGYATVGEVVETGANVDGEWLGREVFAFNPHDTAFAADPNDLVRVDERLSPESMALLPAAETATSLVMDGRPRIGERVVVFGAGVIGLCTLGLLSSFPLERLVAVDPVTERREHAERMGADVAVAPDDLEGVVESDGDTDGPDLVYELSGQPEALDDAVACAGYDSRVLVGSWYGTKRAALDLGSEFHRDRVSIESSQVSTLAPETRGRWTKDRRLAVATEHLRELEPASLVTHRIPFEEAPSAYELLDDDPGDALQVLLTYS